MANRASNNRKRAKKAATQQAAEVSSKDRPDILHDIRSCRAPQDYLKSGGVKRKQLRVAARSRPPKDKFFRVHPFNEDSDDWCLTVLLFECHFEGDLAAETFIVQHGTEAFNELQDKLRPALIVAAILRGGSKFLWELKLPTAGGNRNANGWAESRLQIASAAQTEWVKPVADMEAGGYQMDNPLHPETFAKPDWTGVDFDELLRVAYAKRIITTMDHDAVREHLGG